jgi:carbon-monoxide dehydrogenase medium subunit
MKPAQISYQRARSLADAILLLAQAGEDARVLGGGQSLVPMMNFRAAQPEALIDISACEDLRYVRLENGFLTIGGASPQLFVERHRLVRDHCPMIAQALARAGPRTVRNRATMGGGLANGYPLGHMVCVAVCLDAQICLISQEGERVLNASEFFLDAMTTDLAEGEILREVRFAVAEPGDRSDFRQLANHQAGAAVCMLASHLARGQSQEPGLRLAFAGALGVPIRLPSVEALAGSSPNMSLLADAIDGDFASAGYDEEYADEHQRYAREVSPYLIAEARRALGLT